MHATELAPDDQAAKRLQRRVEAPHEPDLDLDPRLLHLAHEVDRLFELAREGLLAEARDPAIDRASDELGVRRSGCADDHRVRVQRERLVERQGAGADARGQGLCPFHVEIGDDELADAARLREARRVHRTDLTRPAQEHPHTIPSFPAPRAWYLLMLERSTWPCLMR